VPLAADKPVIDETPDQAANRRLPAMHSWSGRGARGRMCGVHRPPGTLLASASDGAQVRIRADEATPDRRPWLRDTGEVPTSDVATPHDCARDSRCGTDDRGAAAAKRRTGRFRCDGRPDQLACCLIQAT
jgi:hypothetical protein